jgi:hypothetical protein
MIKTALLGAEHLGHHSSPCDDISFAFSTSLFLQSNQGLKQAFQMIICFVIELLEGIKTLG